MRTPADPVLDRRGLVSHVAMQSFFQLPSDGRVAAEVVPTPATSLDHDGSLAEVLLSRTAQRFYSDAPVPRAMVDLALESARAVERSLFGGFDASELDLDFLVVANRVDDTPREFWMVTPTGTETLGQLPSYADLADLVLQVEYSWAPVTIMAIGHLDQALTLLGPAGHRHLLTRAGAAMHGSWLSMVAAGMVGSIYAGLVATPLRSIADVDGHSRLGLLAFAFGYPPAFIGP
jgi:hypothetical protein